jgi:N-acyl-D-amino-acid deacylase
VQHFIYFYIFRTLMRNLYLILLALCFLTCQGKKKYDLIIRNALVYDGTGTLPLNADVAVNGDTIAFVGDLAAAEGNSIIDARGLALAPGFIDTHSHHDWNLSDNPDALAPVSQGITTIIVGQDGGSNTPLRDFFKILSDSGVALNVASYSGHNTLRDMVMGKDFKRKAKSSELDSMMALLKDDLEAGALGLSTGLEYDPGIYSQPDEVLKLAGLLPQYHGRYISHIRSEDRDFWEALNEVIVIGKTAKVPVQVSHVKLAMKSLWGQADSVLQIVSQARDSGVNITADIYPYTFWSSTIRVLFPARNFRNLNEAEFILREVANPEGIILNSYDPNPGYEGRNLLDIAVIERKSPAKMLVDLIARLDECEETRGKECSGSIVASSMAEADIVKLMTWEHTNICSDGASMGRHPRGWGAFTRILRHYVREKQVMTMEKAISKMTSLSATNLGITKRGTIKPGYYADLVLFNPQTVGDQSTIDEPQKMSTGIETVWVNGSPVFIRGKATGRMPGRIIKRKSS